MKIYHPILISFYLRGKSQKFKSIYIQIKRNRERIRFSSNLTVNPLDWDEVNGRLKLSKESILSINNQLSYISSYLLNEYNRLSQVEYLEDLEVLKNSLFPKKMELKLEEIDNPLIVDLIDRFNQENEEKYVAKIIANSTYRGIKMLLKKFKLYVKTYYASNNFRLNDIDRQFFSNYERYLLGRVELSSNYISKILKVSKRVFNHSYEMGWINQMPRISFKTKYKNPIREILTKEEIDRIEALNNLPKYLEEARDCAIVQLNTGLAYSDLRALNKIHLKTFLGRNWIIIERQKTGVQSKIVILDKVQRIIDNYMTPNRGNILPVKSNKQYNGYLKEIQGLCGIQTKISSHILRHSFATVIALSSGMSLETLSKVLGHTQIKTTAIYGKVLDKKVLEEFEKLC